MDYLDIGQDVTIFDKFDLSFKERSILTKLVNKAFQKKTAAEISDTILSYVQGDLLNYARANKETRAKALEAVDYLLVICRNKNGKPFIPVLSKQLNEVQYRISGGAISESM